MCHEDLSEYRTKLMIAGDFNMTNATVIYNSIAIHTPPIAVNLYTNALIQKLFKNGNARISVANEPIQLKKVVCIFLSYVFTYYYI